MIKCNKDQVERLKKALKSEREPIVRQRIQTVLLREDGKTQPEIADIMGVSLSTVNRTHMAYDHGGRAALRPKPTGGRIRENMTLEEEKIFLNRFAKAAGAGELLNVQDLKAAYEKAIGHPTSQGCSTLYTESVEQQLHDPRRAEGKLYQLPYVLLFSILAIVTAPTRTGAFARSSTYTSNG